MEQFKEILQGFSYEEISNPANVQGVLLRLGVKVREVQPYLREVDQIIRIKKAEWQDEQRQIKIRQEMEIKKSQVRKAGEKLNPKQMIPRFNALFPDEKVIAFLYRTGEDYGDYFGQYLVIIHENQEYYLTSVMIQWKGNESDQVLIRSDRPLNSSSMEFLKRMENRFGHDWIFCDNDLLDQFYTHVYQLY